MKYIPLYRSTLTTTVNDELFEILSGFRWYGHKDKQGNVYAATYFNKKRVFMHRMILGVLNTPRTFIDHINHNTLDNRRENLRRATTEENNRNRRSSRKFKGVYLTRSNRYCAAIRHKRKSVGLGTYATPEEAAQAYDIAARKLHGEFAYVNFKEVA